MGNCQAIDTATLIIQHPNGKIDRLYCPVNASEIMKMNPGHHVALLISTKICTSEFSHSRLDSNNHNPVRLTRIKLLKPTDSLVLGQAYRLITAQEVMQGLKAKKEAKMKKCQLDFEGKAGNLPARGSELENYLMTKPERNRSRKSTSTATKSRSWQPSLQSISEAGS